jgi:hypothetical protein
MHNADNAEYSLLSSTRYDNALLNVAWNTRVNGGIPSRFMLLPYHFDRLVAAVEEHEWVASRQRMAWVDFATACDKAVEAARPQCGDGPFKVSLKSFFLHCLADLSRFASSCLLEACSR